MRRAGWCWLLIGLLQVGLLGVPSARAFILGVNANLATTTVNQLSRYSIQFLITTELMGGDIIYIQFPENTGLAPGTVRVNGQSTAMILNSSSSLAILCPKSFSAGTSINVEILPGTCTNPSIPGSYQLTVWTSMDPLPVVSNPYTITASTQSLNLMSFSCDACIVANPSDYQIQFSTGSEGGLWAEHSRIFLEFSAGVFLNPGAAILADVNGQQAPATVQGSTLVLICPVDVANNATVTVDIPPQSGIRQPAYPGLCFFRISTDAQPNSVAMSYMVALGPTLTSGSVAVDPDWSGLPANYIVTFSLGQNCGLWAGTSCINLDFPSGTGVPDGAISGIAVNGTPAAGEGIRSQCLVHVYPAQDLPALTDVKVDFAAGAGLINPAAGGTYSMSVSTTVQPMGPAMLYVCRTLTPTSSPTSTVSSTRTLTSTHTLTSTSTATPTATATLTSTLTPTAVVTATPTMTATLPVTATPTMTGTPLVTATPTMTDSPQVTATPTTTDSPTTTASPTTTVSPTATRTATATRTVTATKTATPSKSSTATITPTSTISPSVTCSLTMSPSATASTLPVDKTGVMAYPQPARGQELWFYYWNQGPSQVTVEIYNVTGERVETLNESRSEAGYVRIRWDIHRAGAGVYLYRMITVNPSGRRDFGLRKLVIVN